MSVKPAIQFGHYLTLVGYYTSKSCADIHDWECDVLQYYREHAIITVISD